MKVRHLVTSFPKTSETFILDRIASSVKIYPDQTEILSFFKGENEIEHESLVEYDLLKKTNYLASNNLINNLWIFGKIFSEKPLENIRFILNSDIRSKEKLFRIILLRKKLQDSESNTINAHFFDNAKLCAEIKSNTSQNFKLITSLYGTNFRRVKKSEKMGALIEETDIFIAISESQRQKLVSFGVDESKVKIVRNGVDTDLFKPIEIKRDELEILTVARLSEEKNLAKALKCIKSLEEKTDKAFKYKIIGDGEDKEKLKYLKEKYDINAEFLGFKNGKVVAKQMGISDIFLLTSSEETLPTVLIEAQSAGTATVSTDVGDISEIIDDGKTGFLENDESKIVEKLVRLTEDENLREKMGVNGRRKVVEEFSQDENMERLNEIYKELGSAPE